MQANSPNAFFLSTFLHAGVVALIFLLNYLTSDGDKKPPKIFELVAGEGDNYMATEAPALGEEGGVKMPPIPQPPVIKSAPEPEPLPEPVTRAPEPVIKRAPEPIQRAPEPKPAPTKKPAADEIRDFSKDVKRISQKRQARLEAADKKKREAEERKAREEALKKQRMTKEEFDRLNKGAKAPTGSSSMKIARVQVPEGIRGGVVGGSTANKTGGANGKALTREQGDALDLYFSLLKQKLKEALDKPPGLSDSLMAIVEVYIGADGRLGNPKIKRSSGSSEFDQAAMEAVARVRSIGAKPDGKGEVINIPFRMREDDEE